MDLEKIGPYKVTGKLGAGGMGTVYRGVHEESGREAAIKVLAPSLSREEGFVARFSREVESLRKLSNPHVVEFYESNIDGDLYYFAMEYVEGETLTQKLRREKRIDWRDVIEIATQICAALKSAHDAGVIHRDLKPSNLMITKQGDVKLTDFGVAQMFASAKLTVTGGIIGTAEYMSPEQAQGKRVTKKSDLYSLGAVMYVMLTGRPPFRGQTILEVIQKHKYGQFDHARTIVPEIPYWLDELVCQLLEKDPEKRVPDAYVLSRRLQEIIKKVELSQSEMTLSLDAKSYDEAAPTVEIGAKPGEPPTATTKEPVEFPHESGGTLVRDILQQEIDRSEQKTPVQMFLDNTWVLVSMMLCVLFGFYIWSQQPSAPAENVIDTNSDGSVLRLHALDIDWTKTLKRSVPERLYGRAVRQLEAGQTERSKETLLSLLGLLESSGGHESLVEKVQERLAEIEKQTNEFLDEHISQAEELLQNQELPAAQKLISSLNTLYGEEARVRKLVEKYNQIIKQKQPSQ